MNEFKVGDMVKWESRTINSVGKVKSISSAKDYSIVVRLLRGGEYGFTKDGIFDVNNIERGGKLRHLTSLEKLLC